MRGGARSYTCFDARERFRVSLKDKNGMISSTTSSGIRRSIPEGVAEDAWVGVGVEEWMWGSGPMGVADGGAMIRLSVQVPPSSIPQVILGDMQVR